MVLNDEFEALAKENQGKRTDLIGKYKDYIRNLSSEPRTGLEKTEAENRKRRTENCVNSKLAQLANVSERVDGLVASSC